MYLRAKIVENEICTSTSIASLSRLGSVYQTLKKKQMFSNPGARLCLGIFIAIPDLFSNVVTSLVALDSNMLALRPTKVGHAVPTACMERAIEEAGASETAWVLVTGCWQLVSKTISPLVLIQTIHE